MKRVRKGRPICPKAVMSSLPGHDGRRNERSSRRTGDAHDGVGLKGSYRQKGLKGLHGCDITDSLDDPLPHWKVLHMSCWYSANPTMTIRAEKCSQRSRRQQSLQRNPLQRRGASSGAAEALAPGAGAGWLLGIVKGVAWLAQLGILTDLKGINPIYKLWMNHPTQTWTVQPLRLAGFIRALHSTFHTVHGMDMSHDLEPIWGPMTERPKSSSQHSPLEGLHWIAG